MLMIIEKQRTRVLDIKCKNKELKNYLKSGVQINKNLKYLNDVPICYYQSNNFYLTSY